MLTILDPRILDVYIDENSLSKRYEKHFRNSLLIFYHGIRAKILKSFHLVSGSLSSSKILVFCSCFVLVFFNSVFLDLIS